MGKQWALTWAAATGALAVVSVARADPVNQVAYATLTGTGLVTFDDLPGNTNYDNVFESGGALFGERFAGQTLSFNGDSDVLSGTATNSLTAVAGAANQNLSILVHTNGSNVLTGLGNKGYPAFDAIGEGAFAVLFDFNQSEFGFELVGGNGGSATADFFRRDGSLISSVTLSNLTDTFYGFQREGGVSDIAGVSIYNIDGGGIGFDNLRHSIQGVPGTPDPTPVVPVPAAVWGGMMLLGGLGATKRLRRNGAADVA